jgi:hypothetical protein
MLVALGVALGGNLAGCHELLGLDGVSYREPGTDGGGAVGGVGGGGGAAGTGGAGGSQLTGEPQWARRVGEDGEQRGLTASFNSAGDVIVVGLLDGAALFNGTTLSNSQGNPDVVVLAFGPFGAERSGRRFGASPAIWGVGTAAGANTIVAGRYDGSLVNPGGGDLPDPSPALVEPNGDIYVVKYDHEGDHRWSVTAGAEGEDGAFAVAASGGTGVFVAGSFADTVSLGSTDLTSYGGLDAFVTRVNDDATSASFAWARSFGSADQDLRVRGLATTPFGDVVVLTHELPLDEPSSAPGDFSIHRLSGDEGSAVWLEPRTFTAGLQVGAIAVDPSDHVLLYAAFSGTVTTPVGELLSTGAVDLLLARLAPDGTLQWVRQYPSDADVSATCIAVDGSGNVLLAGSLEGNLMLDDTTLSAPGAHHAFIAKLDSTGTVLWARAFGDSTDKTETYGAGCAAAPTGEALLTGRMQGTVNFTSNVLTADDAFDLFVVKLAP